MSRVSRIDLPLSMLSSTAKQSRMFLYASRERVQMARSRVRRQRHPLGQRASRAAFTAACTSAGGPIADAREDGFRRWIDDVEQRRRAQSIRRR